MQETRASPRFKIKQLVTYTNDGEEYLSAEGLDISRGGIKCSSARVVDPMTSVFVMLKVPTAEGERLVRCEGYVSHSAKTGGNCVFGVRFSSIDPEDRPTFESFLAGLEAGGAERA